MTTFPYETTVQVRFQDLDALGHVNNAVYATYLEEGRIGYFTDHVDIDPSSIQTVVAHLEMDFERPLTDTAPVSVAVGTTAMGEKSYTLGYEVRRDGQTIVSAETVQVWIDRETGTAAELPTHVRERLEADVATSGR
jgi:acyl-CoA thioester hydrolase